MELKKRQQTKIEEKKCTNERKIAINVHSSSSKNNINKNRLSIPNKRQASRMQQKYAIIIL